MASYKRVLAFLMAILMIVCLFPVPAFAAGPEDEGVNANEGEVLSTDNEIPVKEPTDDGEDVPDTPESGEKTPDTPEGGEDEGNAETAEPDAELTDPAFTLGEVLSDAMTPSEAPEATLCVCATEVSGSAVTVTFRAEGPARIRVDLLNEDSETEDVLASGSLDVTGSGEEEKTELTLVPADGGEMPEFYLVKATVSLLNESGEITESSAPFICGDYTRRNAGVSLEGITYFDEYLPADHVWAMEDGHIVYAATAVVISAEECAVLERTVSGSMLQISPAPTQIRNMSDGDRAEITAVVFAESSDPTGHSILRIAPGTVTVSDDGGSMSAQLAPEAVKAPQKGSSGSGDTSRLRGVYESIRLASPAGSTTQTIPLDGPQGTGTLEVTTTGKGWYEFEFYLVDYLEHVEYEIVCSTNYNIQLHQTTGYDPVDLNDSDLHDRFAEGCLDVGFKDPVMVRLDFSQFMIDIASLDIPNYMHFMAASNQPITAVGNLTTSFRLIMTGDLYTSYTGGSSSFDVAVTSRVDNTDCDRDEAVYWVSNALETDINSGNQLLSIDAEGGAFTSVFRNDTDFEDAENEKGVLVRDGKIHFCGNAPMPDNYCLSLVKKTDARYDYRAKLGLGMRGSGSKTTGKVEYSYISKAYGEELTGTDPKGKKDQCKHYGYRIDVTVYDRSGAPAAGATVRTNGTALPREERFRTAVTDENGHAVIYVPDGNWNVIAETSSGGNIGSEPVTIQGRPTSVLINYAPTYITRVKLRENLPQCTGEALPGRYGEMLVEAVEPRDIRLDQPGCSEWKDRYGDVITDGKAVRGAQFQEVTLYCKAAHWTAGRIEFSKDLAVEIFDFYGNRALLNAQPVYVHVSDDGHTAKVLIRLDTFNEDDKPYTLTVRNGWGTGMYLEGEAVLLAAYDLSEYGEDLGIRESLEEQIRASVPAGWTSQFMRWKERDGKLSYPGDFMPEEEGKYSLCTVRMPAKDLYIECSYKTLVDRFTVSLPVPGSVGALLPGRYALTLDTPLPDTVMNCDASSWVDSSGVETMYAAEGDQFLTLKVSATESSGTVGLNFADELDITVTDNGTEGNEKYRLVGYSVSEDKRTATVVILVHISKPGVSEHYLTVNYGFLSGWYEDGTLIPIVSYDVPFLKDKLEDYLGNWAIVIKEILPPSWQLSFADWKVVSPSDGSVKYKDDFIPIVTKEGTTYAAAFFRMPSCDAEITAEYEGLTEIKEVVMDFDLPKPGSFMDYNAESSTEGVKSAVKYMDKLGWFPMVWDTILRADYNKSYTAFIPLSPKDGYKFGWPLGLTTKAYVPSPTGEGTVEADHFFAVADYALITHTYRTPKAQLLYVIDPAPVYFDNGTPESEINAYLQSVETKIMTEAGTDNARVKWSVVSDTGAGGSGRFTYDSTLETRQEVFDNADNTYTLKGTVILPANVRNEEEAGHAVVDQTVKLTVIIRAKDGDELYPPIADPDSCVSSTALEIALQNDPRNPSDARIMFNTAIGRAESYTSPISLPKRDRDTSYVIETWTEYNGKTSPTVRYTYTILASGRYDLKVNGGKIAGINEPEAIVDAGTAVTVEAVPNGTYEVFDHWKFKGLTDEQPTESSYGFTMPANDVTATAVFRPGSDDITLIDTAALQMEIPAAGIALSETVTDSSLTAVPDSCTVSAASPSEIEWNVEGYPQAESDKSYSAVIRLRIDELLVNGAKNDKACFSGALTATVNGQEAEVIVDPSGKYAAVLVSFDVPRTEFTVSYDANGGDALSVPEPQTKQAGVPLPLSEAVLTRDGYVFLGWSSLKDGGLEYAPGDLYENDDDIVLYAVWQKDVKILKVQAAFGVPAKPDDPLPTASGIAVKALEPTDAAISLKKAQWTDDFGLAAYSADYGDQYLTLTVRATDPDCSFADDLAAAVKDTSSGGNDKVTVESVRVSDDKHEAEITICVHISKPGATEYYLTVDGGLGSGYYEAGDKVLIISYDIKSISTILKELLPEYKTIISLAEYFAEKLTGSFERWEVIEPDDGSLTYKDDFLPIILKSGKTPKVTYAAAFFTMPAADTEIKAIYGSPTVIDSVTMSLAVPQIGQKLSELAACVNPTEGVKPVPFMGKDGRYKIEWSGPSTVGYNEKFTARVFVTAESGYKLDEFLNIVTLDAYFTKGFDFDNGVQPSGYAKGDCLGFMDYAILSYTYKTPKAQLLSVVQPNTVYFPGGTTAEEINDYLKNLDIVYTSEAGQGKAKANWGTVIDTSAGQTGRFTYDSTLETRQEVLDVNTGVYKVQGTMILPGSIRNTQTAMHKKADQTVEITVVILEMGSTELLPPTAAPDSCESETALEVELIDSELNPERTELWYTLTVNGVKGEAAQYTDKIPLAQNAADTEYVIEAWAKNGEDQSETASFTYLVKAVPMADYTVKVIGGTVEKDGESHSEDFFAAGETVNILADPNSKYEKFDHWEFDSMTDQPTTEAYTFEMPANNVTATAIFVPLSDDDMLVKSVALTLTEPTAGAALAETIDAGAFTGDECEAITPKELCGIVWLPEDRTEAREGETYTAFIVVQISDLWLDGEELPESTLFSGSFTATVNGKEARVTVDESRKFVTIEAEFTVAQTNFTVSYDANGGDADSVPASQTKQLGAALTLTTDVPTWTDYAFIGWAAEPDAAGAEYDPGDAYTQDEDITLYAVWKPIYTVSAAASEGGTASPAEQQVTEGEKAAVVFTPLVQDIGSWMLDKVVLYDTDPALGTDITDRLYGYTLTLENVRENMKVYGFFKTAPYTVKAEIVEGKGRLSPESTGVEDGGTVEIALFPDEGYELAKAVSWILIEGKRSETDVTAKVTDGVLTLTDVHQDINVEFYLKEKEYTVSYDDNGGSGAPAAQVKKYLSDLVLSSDIPVRAGYRFIGWSTDSAAVEAQYAPGDVFKINRDTTLYAVWARLFLVTAECSEGGTADPAEQYVPAGETASVTFTPMAGWSLYKVTMYTDEPVRALRAAPGANGLKAAPSGGIDVTDRVINGVLTLDDVTRNVRLYAEFKADPHTVTARVVSGKGEVSPTYAKVEHGGSITVTITPESGCEIRSVKAWYGDSNKAVDVTNQVVRGELRLDNVSQDVRLEIRFRNPLIPETGDTSHLGLWTLSATVSALAQAYILTRLRKKRKS